MAAPLAAPGHMGVDYEQRVDFARLRDYRIGRAKESLEARECGAVLLELQARNSGLELVSEDVEVDDGLAPLGEG